jgi:hypothetical protein
MKRFSLSICSPESSKLAKGYDAEQICAVPIAKKRKQSKREEILAENAYQPDGSAQTKHAEAGLERATGLPPARDTRSWRALLPNGLENKRTV